MEKIESGAYTYIPTNEIEVSQNKKVYEAYFLDDFVGYRVKVPSIQLINGVQKKKGFHFEKCQKVYEDINGDLKFILG